MNPVSKLPGYRPEIAKKALLMVLAPALLSTGLLLYLNQQWIDEGIIAKKQGKNYEIVTHEFFNMEHAKEVTEGVKGSVSAADVLQRRKLAAQEMELVKTAAREGDITSTTLALIDKLASAQSHALRDLNNPKPQDALVHLNNHNMDLDDVLAATRILYKSAPIFELAEALDEAMDDEVKMKWMEQQDARQQIKLATVLLFLTILTMAMLLVWRFSKDIVKRLNALMENAQFVGNHRRSLGPLPGRDELAYMNSVLIDADGELKKADEERKSIMEMVAHDMRSPLMASQVSLEIVQELSNQSLPEKAQQSLSMAKRNLQRVLQFIEELLSIEKLEAGDVELNCEKFSVLEVVDDVVGSLSELALKRGIKLINHCHPMIMEADKRRIGQVLTNFISNAIKFSPENSEITISNDTVDDQQRIAVKDRGRGMDRATCYKVFDRYFQTAEGRKKEGYGLGLAICRLLMEAHGGAVGAESELGKGSTFWLKVPLEQLEKAQSAGLSEAPQTARSDKQTISFIKRKHFIDLVHPRILEKVLICALFPLILQACMLAWIGYGMIETERLSDKEGELFTTMHCVNYTVIAIGAADLRLVKYFLTGKPKYRQLAIADFAKCTEKIEQFQRLRASAVTTSSELRDCVTTLELMKRLEALSLNSLENKIENLTKLGELTSNHNRAINLDKEEVNTHKHLIANEEELMRLSREEQVQRMDVQSKIYFGIAANLLFATLLIVFFSQNVTKRLNVLVDHARNLPKREPIASTVSGDDELSYLDLILQRTAGQLIESAEHRRSVMQMVAHDMRSPMMAAQASIELLNAVHGESLPPVGRRHLPNAEKNIDRILHLVNDLLTLDKLEAGKLDLELTTCSVRQLADDAISTVSSLAAKRSITVVNECEDGSINVDAARLNQVLANFISNAIKFSPDNSVISLISRSTDDSISIGVQDRGPGLAKETAERVFDKFFQAEDGKKVQGFGLGLAICKLIVESHGGSVFVETELGKGATFWMKLPRTTPL
jgi:signal transduction histidine kinase